MCQCKRNLLWSTVSSNASHLDGGDVSKNRNDEWEVSKM